MNNIQGVTGLTATQMNTILFIVIVLVVILLLVKFVKKVMGRIITLIVAALFFTGGSKINTMIYGARAVKQVMDKVAEKGTTQDVRVTDNNKFQVEVNGKWLDADKITNVIGDGLTSDLEFEYEGQTIRIGKSGLAQTIKLLQDMGVMK